MKTKTDAGIICCLVSIDLKKAFGSVSRENLLQKLKLYGISDFWVRSYQSDRKQFVSFDNNNSSLQPSYRGVPQGSILSPFFRFLLMIILIVYLMALPN